MVGIFHNISFLELLTWAHIKQINPYSMLQVKRLFLKFRVTGNISKDTQIMCLSASL